MGRKHWFTINQFSFHALVLFLKKENELPLELVYNCEHFKNSLKIELSTDLALV